MNADPPTVDPETAMVLAAALGIRSYARAIIAIDSLTETSDEVVVHVRTRPVGTGCIVGSFGYAPGRGRGGPRPAEAVRFVDRVQFIDCD